VQEPLLQQLALRAAALAAAACVAVGVIAGAAAGLAQEGSKRKAHLGLLVALRAAAAVGASQKTDLRQMVRSTQSPHVRLTPHVIPN
jgi:hypothetical protein